MILPVCNTCPYQESVKTFQSHASKPIKGVLGKFKKQESSVNMYFMDNTPVPGVSLLESSWECGVLAGPQLISRVWVGRRVKHSGVSYRMSLMSVCRTFLLPKARCSHLSSCTHCLPPTYNMHNTTFFSQSPYTHKCLRTHTDTHA